MKSLLMPLLFTAPLVTASIAMDPMEEVKSHPSNTIIFPKGVYPIAFSEELFKLAYQSCSNNEPKLIINEKIEDEKLNKEKEKELWRKIVSSNFDDEGNNYFIADGDNKGEVTTFNTEPTTTENNFRFIKIMNVKIPNMSKLSKYRYLKRLTLKNCGLQSICNLPLDLEVLKIEKNKSLEELPSLDDHTEIVTLILRHNALKSFPILPRNPKSSLLPALRKIVISDNKITDLPEDMPSQIEHLDVSENLLRHIPISYGSLVKLTYFKFGKNHISEVPQEITDLPSLKTLEGDGNLIYKLPSEFQPIPRNKAYKMLESLNFSRNFLKTIPNSIFNLGKITKLDFSYNGINELEIPEGTLPNLEEIFLQGNKMSRLSTKGELPNLTILNVSDNCLSELEINGSSIKQIDISDNIFGKIPDFIFNLKSLDELNARNIAIQQIPDKPLKCNLDLSKNNILEVTTECLTKLKNHRLQLSTESLSTQSLIIFNSWKKNKNIPLE